MTEAHAAAAAGECSKSCGSVCSLSEQRPEVAMTDVPAGAVSKDPAEERPQMARTQVAGSQLAGNQMAGNLAVFAVAGPVAAGVAANGALAQAGAAAAATTCHGAGVHASLPPTAVAQQHVAVGCMLVEQGVASGWAAG